MQRNATALNRWCVECSHNQLTHGRHYRRRPLAHRFHCCHRLCRCRCRCRFCRHRRRCHCTAAAAAPAAAAVQVRELWAAGATRSANPKHLKGVLARFNEQFAGHDQHDAQELLNILLNGLHEDLNRITHKVREGFES
jgi:Ubiquitin carboxyl-terminal hydrolase